MLPCGQSKPPGIEAISIFSSALECFDSMLFSEEDPGTPRLRVSVAIESNVVPAWVAELVRQLRRATFISLQGAFITGSAPSPAETSKRSFLFKQYLQWDRQHRDQVPDPFELVDLTADMADVLPIERAFARTDVFVWLTDDIPDTGIGGGSFRFLRFSPGMDESSYFWGLYRRESVNRSDWEYLEPGTWPPKAITTGFASNEEGWSLGRNSTVPYWTAPALLLKSLRLLAAGDAPFRARQGNDPEADKTQPSKGPSNIQMAAFFGRNALRSLRRRIVYAGREPHWFMAYRTNSKLFVPQNESFVRDGFRVVDAPADRFFADPFAITVARRSYIFFEDYLYREGKGVISVIEIDSKGEAGPCHRVLERPYHLSYPFVFEHEGQVYMIPETMDAHRIELYRALDFPFRWELIHVLRENVDAVDTTLYVQDGVFYYFTNIAERGVTPNDLLYLFCTDSLTGRWYPHPANPVCSDVRQSRAAGKLFQKNGRLIRPAQDCSHRYGYACQLNEVHTLSTTEFRESPVARIEPDWFPGLIGTHTINSDDAIEVIDGQIYKARHE